MEYDYQSHDVWVFIHLIDRTSYPQISWSLEGARLYMRIIVSLWNNLTGVVEAVSRLCYLYDGITNTWKDVIYIEKFLCFPGS